MSYLCMNDCVRMQMWYSGGRLCSRGSAKFTDGLHEVRSRSGRFFLVRKCLCGAFMVEICYDP